ncbi:putative membrane protein [Sphingomonas sp. BE138]|uniref:DUF1003 domain-containing protein n=1 Tax=Sphingomonas sp. BE138 TaxID=2817845 RepID=UPI002862419F|nr:DUF1003 domain-containing protein [Sphingomonas sp. BE138]MDR6788089.1 putative membrane protein [Sphingomonas sp. BE138]
MAHRQPIADLALRLLGKPRHSLDDEERRVLDSMDAGTTVSRDAADEADLRASFGDRLADKVAAVGGSWGFIIGFTVVLLGWMLLNTDVLAHFGMQFDPYPYIFLNLMLSTLAAVQAPVIMMSQNRQASKDRLAASLDYETNLRAELEILRLHEKLDLIVAERLAGLEAKIDRLANGGPGA